MQFCKAEIAAQIDEGDNFNDRRAIIYARNACWDLAKRVGCRYFIQLDDDYLHFDYRTATCSENGYVLVRKTINSVLDAFLEFYLSTPCLSIAMSQGGDWIGGIGGGQGRSKNCLRRKCMNTFICSTDRRFQFFGRINEDVNTYTTTGRRGGLFFTVLPVMVNQITTQSNPGGMTDLYHDGGTYLKTFYSVMYAPSCVKIGQMGDPRSPHYRIHHMINWNTTVPRILREEWKKA